MTSNEALAAALDSVTEPGFTAAMERVMEQFTILDEEIAKASAERPGFEHLLFHAEDLMRPTHPRMTTPFVYRAHVRELLARAVAGEDLRPATAAEVVLVCSEMSLRAPLHAAAAGLYCRMFSRVYDGPDNPWDGQAPHYEALHGPEIDRLEADERRHAAQGWRKLAPPFECGGVHHGEPVECHAAEQAAVAARGKRTARARSARARQSARRKGGK